jgi:ABC-type polysaccharide/polyol phosphate transport system ATPase subunit
MTADVIRAEKLGKRFARIHQKPMLFRDLAMSALGQRRARSDEFWALRSVSFSVKEGETFGVVGPNGSGKSTLLSLVAGTSFPNEGSISTRGRISVLLELGSGFHADMSGEENIIVNAGLLGARIEEARALMSRIVAFAELEEFIDTPIRHYSSGMLARLGFSIAIHVSPHLVIVDEVLAVGDIAFQAKCMQEIERMKSDGTTIVIVSQSPDVIGRVCDRALWLESGGARRLGPASEVAQAYAAAMLVPRD